MSWDEIVKNAMKEGVCYPASDIPLIVIEYINRNNIDKEMTDNFKAIIRDAVQNATVNGNNERNNSKNYFIRIGKKGKGSCYKLN